MRLNDDKFYADYGLDSPYRVARKYFLDDPPTPVASEFEARLVLSSLEIGEDIATMVCTHGGITEDEAKEILREHDADVITAWKGML